MPVAQVEMDDGNTYEIEFEGSQPPSEQEILNAIDSGVSISNVQQPAQDDYAKKIEQAKQIESSPIGKTLETVNKVTGFIPRALGIESPYKPLSQQLEERQANVNADVLSGESSDIAKLKEAGKDILGSTAETGVNAAALMIPAGKGIAGVAKSAGTFGGLKGIEKFGKEIASGKSLPESVSNAIKTGGADAVMVAGLSAIPYLATKAILPLVKNVVGAIPVKVRADTFKKAASTYFNAPEEVSQRFLDNSEYIVKNQKGLSDPKHLDSLAGVMRGSIRSALDKARKAKDAALNKIAGNKVDISDIIQQADDEVNRFVQESRGGLDATESETLQRILPKLKGKVSESGELLQPEATYKQLDNIASYIDDEIASKKLYKKPIGNTLKNIKSAVLSKIQDESYAKARGEYADLATLVEATFGADASSLLRAKGRAIEGVGKKVSGDVTKASKAVRNFIDKIGREKSTSGGSILGQDAEALAFKALQEKVLPKGLDIYNRALDMQAAKIFDKNVFNVMNPSTYLKGISQFGLTNLSPDIIGAAEKATEKMPLVKKATSEYSKGAIPMIKDYVWKTAKDFGGKGLAGAAGYAAARNTIGSIYDNQ